MVLAPREVVSVDVSVTFDTLWEHLRRPELIRRWWGWDRPGLDMEIRQTFLIEAVIQRSETGMAIGFLRWHNHDRLEARGTFGGRTRVTVRRPDALLLASSDGVRDDVDESWITAIHQLKYALDNHLGQERRCFAVRGVDFERPDRLLYRAGLHDARGVPLGGAVEIRRPDGSLLGGTLEYRTANQFGVRILGHGGSLLVVQVLPAASHPPKGAINVFWSTYGLDDETLAIARHRWSAWWSSPVDAHQT